MISFRSVRAACVAALIITPTVGFADDCPEWFPDLRCEREARFPGFIPPGTAPFYFEDPFITTGISLWGLWHDFPESGVFQGGDLRGVAAQIRVALTDRLGLIASKDGRISLRPDNDLLDTENGYGDLGFGLKYALIRDVERGFILTPAIRYEATQGTRSVLAGNGQGVWVPSTSFGLALDEYHVLGNVGIRIPVDQSAESTVLFYNLHVDRELWEGFSPFIEVNGYHYTDDGNGRNTIKLGNGTRLPISTVQNVLGLSGFEGYDAVNLGSANVEGNDIIVGALGFRAQINRNVSIGVAYERPLTRRKDILKQRVSLNVLIER